MEELAKALFHAKQAEKEAKAKRVELEEKIANQVSTDENGSKTVDVGAGLKVTVKRGLIYSADVDAIREVAGGEELLQTVTKTTLDPKAYESCREAMPELFKSVSGFVTTKPRKVAVTLKIA